MIRIPKNFSSRHLTFLVFSLVFLIGACQKEPEWSPEIRNFLENTNRELEEIAPHFARDSSQQIVIAGLTRMDKAMDRIVVDLRTFFKKYPSLLKDPKPIGILYGAQVQRLQKNVQSIILDGGYWHRMLEKEKNVDDLVQSILKKMREADKLTRPPN